eukprot:g11606.t1
MHRHRVKGMDNGDIYDGVGVAMEDHHVDGNNAGVEAAAAGQVANVAVMPDQAFGGPVAGGGSARVMFVDKDAWSAFDGGHHRVARGVRVGDRAIDSANEGDVSIGAAAIGYDTVYEGGVDYRGGVDMGEAMPWSYPRRRLRCDSRDN